MEGENNDKNLITQERLNRMLRSPEKEIPEVAKELHPNDEEEQCSFQKEMYEVFEIIG